MKYSVDVEGKRIYVGPRMAFRNIDAERNANGDTYYVMASDRVYQTTPAETATD